MTGLSPTKRDLRAAALARRDALTTQQRFAAADAVAARAFPLEVASGQAVAGYSPIRSEFDPRPLMEALARRGARLALPVIVARDQPLLFRIWSPSTAMVRGQMGIFEPAADAPVVVPDIMLVPLAAFDRTGHRIGYGAGHYDRTFEQLRRMKTIVAVGLAFSVQQVAAVPALPHDVRLDYIVTEHQTIDTRGH
ncbi:5-formyltetrahydrofolate cyclo-ligase [Bradyrhizobium prioriisuperbiae]|uniref:5-formyltetrahydrofolate cyclo-ligase n=1 Tax=Bradyrhizobium prioriisuperbiae TaxID=2854389 RepID=UPI0028EEE7BD|nr:5-formyltetrahydrofolate cyclo-ligase [Bradyrhizobium prioritasuperba]